MAVLGLVLALACANVANLLIAGAITRRREVALRLAIGATRFRVVRQLLTESVMLSVVSGGLALLFSLWFLPVLGRWIDVGPTVEVAPDMRVFIFLGLSTLAVGIGAGLAPARYGVSGDLATPLKGAGQSGGSGRPGRLRSTLAGVQAAASVVLLILAALLARAMFHAAEYDLGFDVDRLVNISARFDAAGYDAPRAADYWTRVAQRIEGMPGIENTAEVLLAPFGGTYRRREVVQSGGREYVAYFNGTTPDYFAAVGISIVRGRFYTDAELASAAPVAVVAESLALGLWEGEEPLGSTLGRIDADLAHVQVIGIAADALDLRMDPDSHMVYQPLLADDALYSSLVVRVEGDVSAVLQPLREAVRAIDPEVLPLAEPVREGVEGALRAPRSMASIASILGLVALGLAVTGVFGLTAFAVEQRTSEIGVRLAVGAGSRDVFLLMLRDSLKSVTVGLCVGVLAALAASRVLANVMYGVSTRDPIAFVAASCILLGATALSASAATRRAASVDPVITLRSE